jgi:hypothetical protein
MAGHVALAGILLASSAVAAGSKARNKGPACASNKVIAASQLRIAQTELMVAGLSCKQYDQWAPTANVKRYNEFVTRYRSTLMDDGHRVLAKYFPTEQRLNDYLTRLANEAQLRGNANMAIFCTQASKIYDDVLNSDPIQLEPYAASLPMSSAHGHQPCEPQPIAAAPAAAPVAPASTATVAAPPVAAAEAAPASQSGGIGALIAQNNAPSTAGVMQPVPEGTMRAAVKNPPVPKLKPEKF